LMFNLLRDAGLRPQHKSYDSGDVHLDIDLTAVSLEPGEPFGHIGSDKCP
jgi:hypothetical protein